MYEHLFIIPLSPSCHLDDLEHTAHPRTVGVANVNMHINRSSLRMMQLVGLIFSIPVRSDGPDWNLPTHAHLSCFNVFAICMVLH